MDKNVRIAGSVEKSKWKKERIAGSKWPKMEILKLKMNLRSLWNANVRFGIGQEGTFDGAKTKSQCQNCYKIIYLFEDEPRGINPNGHFPAK